MTESGRLINLIFIVSLIVVIAGALLRYNFFKEYTFTIETSCDPLVELCFSRDCASEECPPNGYDSYKVFVIPAHDYGTCVADGCLKYCQIESKCAEVICESNNGDICSGIN